MRMWVYVVRRAVPVIPVVIGVLTVLFVLVSSLPVVDRTCAYAPPGRTSSPCSMTIQCPGNPAQSCPNPAYESAVNSLGLNQPVFVQWAIFVGNGLTFHWGYVTESSSLGLGDTEAGLPELDGQSVTSVLAAFLPYSIELLVLAFVIAAPVLIYLQRQSAAYPGRTVDHAARGLTLLGYGIPIFLLGTLALFGATLTLGGPDATSRICGAPNTVYLDFWGSWPEPPCASLFGTTNIGPVGYPNWLGFGYISTPTGFPTVDALLHGNDWLALDTLFRLALPALLLALVAIAATVRYARYDPTPFEFLRAARARGLPESRVVRRYAGRYTVSQMLAGYRPVLFVVLGSLPVVEVLFNLWGVGRLFVLAAAPGTYPPYFQWDVGLTFGTLLAGTLLVLLASFVLDVARAYIDPRSRIA